MKLRLTIVTSAVMLVVYAVLATAVFGLQYRSRFRTVDADLAAAAGAAAFPGGGPPGRMPDGRTLPDQRNGAGRHSDRSSSDDASRYGEARVIVVRDRAGNVVESNVDEPPAALADLAASAPRGDRPDTPVPQYATVSLGDRRWRVATVAWPGGSAQAASPVDAVVGQLSLLGLALAGGALVAVVLAAGATYATAGVALRPLTRMRHVAETVAATEDPSARVPEAGRRDEIGKLASAFNTMLGRLQGAQARSHDALDAQRRFLADASHELRTPVTSLRGNLELWQRHPNLDRGERDQMVAEMAAETTRLSSMVEGLLDLARLDQKGPGDSGWVDVAAVCGDAAAALRSRAGIDGREVVVTDLATSEGVGVHVWGDAEVLRRLVDVLCDNALVHGSGRIDLRVLPPAEGWIRLEVADEGAGVPPGERERIFERFARGAGASGRPGSGLGLSIAAALASGLGAHVGLHETEPATFVVWLPAVGPPVTEV